MPKSRVVATSIGSAAILMWSTLSYFTAASVPIPPFQLAAMAFAIAGLGGLAWIAFRGAWSELRPGWPAWLHGVGGLFGYHFFYFFALRTAPPAEASLIAYLWPLLIVLFASRLHGGQLKWFHLAGAMLGFAGTVIIVGGGTPNFQGEYLAGYLAALACAIIWSTYSLLAGKLAHVPTGAVAGFCVATAVLSAAAHFGLEKTVLPSSPAPWIAVLSLGLFPVGAAFFAWDFGTKHGDVRFLGILSYTAPLLSTLILIATGHAEARWTIAVAAIFIAAAGALASLPALRRLVS